MMLRLGISFAPFAVHLNTNDAPWYNLRLNLRLNLRNLRNHFA